MNDITLSDDYVVSENHGKGLRFALRVWNDADEEITIVYRMHDGTDWLEPKVTLFINREGTVMTKLDGSTKDFPNIKFDTAAVQALLDKTPMNNFIKNQGGDLRTEP